MRNAMSRKTQTPSSASSSPSRLVVAFLAVALAVGCQRNGGASNEGIVPPDAQVAANLANLSRELRRALPRLNKSANFEEFVAVSHVEAPPPPAEQSMPSAKTGRLF